VTDTGGTDRDEVVVIPPNGKHGAGAYDSVAEPLRGRLVRLWEVEVLRARERVNQASATVKKTEASLNRAKADVKSTVEGVEKATKDVYRKTNFPKQYKTNLQDATSKLATAKSALERIEGELAKVEEVLVEEQKRLAAIQRNNPPYDGVTAEIQRRKAEAAAAAERAREAEAAEKRRRAEEEHDSNGLVLLRKTVEGKTNEFGGEITGTVVNRRGRKLRYAQIKFILYDSSGAQVGTALANINDLEAGARWNFKATSFGVKFTSYKFSELSGF
jgi:hypothetical protein